MKSVKKFATFNDLKSYEDKTTSKVRLKRHTDFKKTIAEIVAAKANKKPSNAVKQK